MVLTLAPVTHTEALAILEKINLEVLRQTLQTYQQLRLMYPTIPLANLKPPYGKIASEHPYFPCHINVLFWETYQVRKHDKHFPINHRMTLQDVREIAGPQSSRFMGATGFPTLYKTLANGDDGATLITLDPKHHHPKMTHHRAHINSNATHAMKKLTNHLADQGIRKRLRDGTKEYYEFKHRLADKLYEHVAWPNTGGQKHLAASCLHLNLDSPGLTIDILSKSGTYTRLSSDQDRNPVVQHITIQHKEDLQPLLTQPIPIDYLLDNQYALVSFIYRRVNTYDLEQPWLMISEQELVCPENPQERMPVKLIA